MPQPGIDDEIRARGHHGPREQAVGDCVSAGPTLSERVSALPGFAEEKSQIFVALLAKRFDVKPRGWKAAKKSKSEFSL